MHGMKIIPCVNFIVWNVYDCYVSLHAHLGGE